MHGSNLPIRTALLVDLINPSFAVLFVINFELGVA